MHIVVVSGLPLYRHVLNWLPYSPLFPVLPPFSLILQTTILSVTHSAYPIVSFPLVFFPPTLYHLPQQAFASEYTTDPIFLPSADHIHTTFFFVYHFFVVPLHLFSCLSS